MTAARICLVNPPFAAIRTPSLALTQLRSVLQRELGDRVRVEIHYLNLEIATLLGEERYDLFASEAEGQGGGLGEWLFSRAAFPEAPSRDEEYFERYLPAGRPGAPERRRLVLDLRERAERRLAELVEERELHRARVVGMSSMFFQTTACLALARHIKELAPATATVLGGANCESPMGEVLARHADAIDFVVSGPGLVALPILVRQLLDGDGEACQALPGVFSRRNVDTAEAPASIAPELSLDAEVELDYDSFLAALDRSFPGVAPHLLFETSRGCWWGAKAHCTFCGLNGTTMTHRSMSPERALEQFEALFRYWPRCRYFECVDNLMPHEYLRDVFPRLATPDGARIFYEVKASLTAEQLRMLSAAGVRRMQAGIESLATSTLRLMKKGTTAFQNVSFLLGSLRFGIEPVWNLLVGFPGEDEQVYRRLEEHAARLVHLPPPTGVYTVRFDRFSPYHVRPEAFGLELRPYDFYALVFPFPEESLDDLAYYFMDHARDAEYLTALLRWLEPMRAAVDRWQEAWRVGPPLLRFAGAQGGEILDTRPVARERHADVGAVGRDILEALASPADMAGLARRLGRSADEALADDVRRLDERELLFREGETMLGLVLPAPPAERDEPRLERRNRAAFRVRSDDLPPMEETDR
ncbi:MAG: RiPP maturation radical SAM C-methyltransferase [Thermoanaerobaculia bacterium]